MVITSFNWLTDLFKLRPVAPLRNALFTEWKSKMVNKMFQQREIFKLWALKMISGEILKIFGEKVDIETYIIQN